MNHSDFTELRRRIDNAITYHDPALGQSLAEEGLRMARARGCPGEDMYFRAQIEIAGERFREAVPYLHEALQYNPADGAAYNDLALCRIELGMIDGVEELFDKGIAVEPDYAVILHNKGWFLNNLGRSEEALMLFEQALALEPDRVVTWENKADAFERLGRLHDALDAYRKAVLSLSNSFPQIRLQMEREIRRLESAQGI